MAIIPSNTLSTLSDVGTIARGKSKHRPRNDPALYNGKYPFVQTGDVKRAKLYVTDYTQTYNEAGLAQSKLWPEGTLCITIAANIAESAILGIPACFPDSVIGFTPHSQKSDVRFIKYCLDCYKIQLQSISHGTTQDNLSLQKLESLRFSIPSWSEQRKIAAVLTAYDDLIENNRQRIALLEKMAEEIYREWFVRLRFPGHEHTPIHKGVPEGWQRRSIDDLSLMVKRGISPRYDENSEHTVLNQKCIRDHRVSFDQARFHVTSMSQDKLLRRHDVLINSTGVGTLGRAAIYNLETTKVTVDSHITICRPNTDRVDATFYGFTVRSFESVFENLAAGATGQTELSARLVKSIDMFDPPDILQRRFSEIVRPMLDGQSALLAQSENLAQTRDLLLNRLISGKLRVDDLDIRFPPSMAEDPS